MLSMHSSFGVGSKLYRLALGQSRVDKLEGSNFCYTNYWCIKKDSLSLYCYHLRIFIVQEY